MKQILQKLFLILLPVMAVGLATTQDSVVVFSSQTGVTEYYSYFELLPHSNLQIVTPLAAFLCLVCVILAVIYLFFGSELVLRGIIGMSFCATILAVIPVMLREEVLVVPNVGLPILMIIDFFLANYIRKHPAKIAKRTKGS